MAIDHGTGVGKRGGAVDHPLADERGLGAPRPTRSEGITVAAVTTVFVLVLCAFAVITRPYDAADEMAHLDAVLQLATGHAWAAPGTMHLLSAVHASVSSASAATATWGDLIAGHPGYYERITNQMTQHPPTYYLIGAGFLHLIGFEDLPWDVGVLALRLLDVAFVAPLPVIAWATVRRLTRSGRAGVVGAAAVLAVPQVAVVGSAVTNDAPVLLFSGLVTLVAVRVLTGDRRLWVAVLLALLTGALVWFKGTGLPAVPFVLIAVLWPAVRWWGWRPALLRTVVIGAGTAAVGAWWWLHNLLVYGAVQPDGFIAREAQSFPAGQGPDLAQFVQVTWDTIVRTFWGSSGVGASNAVTPYLSDIGTVLGLVVIAVYAFRRGRTLVPAIALAILPVVILLLQTQTTWSAYLRSTEIAGTQGRYYFPALVALIALSALAWRRLPRSQTGRRRLAAGIGVVSIAIGVYGVWLQWRVSWEGRSILVTSGGIDAYAASGSVPVAVLAVVAVTLAASAVITGALVMRATRSVAVPSTGVPA